MCCIADKQRIKAYVDNLWVMSHNRHIFFDHAYCTAIINKCNED